MTEWRQAVATANGNHTRLPWQ